MKAGHFAWSMTATRLGTGVPRGRAYTGFVAMPKYFLPPVSPRAVVAAGAQPSGAGLPSFPTPSAPSDPQIRAVGEQVLGDLQRSFRAHAAAPGRPAKNDIDRGVQNIVAARAKRAPGRDQARAHAELDGAAPPSSASFSGIQIIDPNAPEPEPEAPAVPRGPRIALVGTEVRCWAETNEAGADEIVLGGFCTDPFGNVTPLDPRMIDDDFEVGELVEYEGGQVLAEVPLLATAPSWPATYSITLTLVEKDVEGFDQNVAQLWSGLQPHVRGRLGAVAGVAGLASRAVPVVAVTSWVVSSFVSWMREWSQDDLIGTRIISVALEGLDDGAFARAGLLNPQMFRLDFKGSGGHYSIDGYLTLLR